MKESDQNNNNLDNDRISNECIIDNNDCFKELLNDLRMEQQEMA